MKYRIGPAVAVHSLIPALRERGRRITAKFKAPSGNTVSSSHQYYLVRLCKNKTTTATNKNCKIIKEKHKVIFGVIVGRSCKDNSNLKGGISGSDMKASPVLPGGLQEPGKGNSGEESKALMCCVPTPSY